MHLMTYTLNEALALTCPIEVATVSLEKRVKHADTTTIIQ
jgi:hypothetical protein